MSSFSDLVNKFNTLVETQRPGPGHQQSKYERKKEKINWDGFSGANYYATGRSGQFLSENLEGGVILALFGPSGAGKSWYKKALVEQGWEDIRTNTTRQPRGPEDTEYNFLSDSEFSELLNKGELINTNEYLGEMYGTRISDFAMAESAVMLTDVTSLDSLKESAAKYGKNLLLVYTAPPDSSVMKQRHMDRGTPERIDVATQETSQEGEIIQRGDIYIIKGMDDLNSLVDSLQGGNERYN